MLRAENIQFAYTNEGVETSILRGVSLEINQGDLVSIQGPSGSGKSTLFYILGCLLRPSAGKIYLHDRELTTLSDVELAQFRNQDLGFVFQQFHLLPRATVLENILLPTLYPNTDATIARQRALELAERVGLSKYISRLPNQLSGGQQQRVAIARSLMNEPDIILADEPTGNLDSKNAKDILNLFYELNEEGRTILLVTHDTQIANSCRSKIYVKDGEVERTESAPSRKATTQPVARSLVTTHVPKKNPFVKFLNTSLGHSVRKALPLAYLNLKRNKTKSLLTMLGVIIGIAAVLAMITLGNFAKRRILESYQSLGVNKVIIRGYRNFRTGALKLETASFDSFYPDVDIDPLKKIFPEILYAAPVLSGWQSSVTAGGIFYDANVTVKGVTPEFFAISNMTVDKGLQIYPAHISTNSSVCVVGTDIAKALFPQQNALDKVISLSVFQKFPFPCKIIGVLKRQSSNNEWDRPNTTVLIPISYYQASVGQGWGAEIREIDIQVKPAFDPALTGQKIKAYFHSKYGASGQFEADSDAKLIAQMKKFLSIFTLLLTMISLLSLVVGGIGINNMMLISVTDRLKEIGLRKALGATNQIVRIQILTESVLLSSVGGLLGIVLGVASYQFMIYAATQFIPNLKYEWVFEPMAALVSLLSIVLVGIGSGFAPAIKAEKLEVIEALRSE